MSQITANANPRPHQVPAPGAIPRGAELLPRSVVVEHNGEAVAPSELRRRQLQSVTGWRS